ncbi:MAG: RidA family protein [Proteobacteria bacterium]|nr:RidA family protein [Pseudomonadota bacterium]
MSPAILQPPGWPRPRGYSNGMMARGTVIVTGGMIGWDEQGRIAPGFAAQAAQALRNVVAVLAEARVGPAQIIRMNWYVTDMDAYRAAQAELAPAWRETMGKVFPAMAVIGVASLVEPEAMVEIEATAILPE